MKKRSQERDKGVWTAETLISAAFVALLFLAQLLVFLITRDESYPQIHDNLDLFTPHYRMMKLQNAWFAHGVDLPVLHGMNRDLFGSEFLLYNLLYIILPDLAAYITGYFLKIAIGFAGFLLLVWDFEGSEKFRRHLPVLLPIAAAYGMIPVFPTYGIAFTSVPIVVFLLRRIHRGSAAAMGMGKAQAFRKGQADAKGVSSIGESASADRADAFRKEQSIAKESFSEGLRSRLLWYVLLFLYPLLSYFSYHGFFILVYMVFAVIILWIRERRFPKWLFISLFVLSAGYIAFEYRLFYAMLFDSATTIRTTMDHGDLSFFKALGTAAAEFVNASFHSEDSHTYLVFPVTIIGTILVNVKNFRAGRGDGDTKSLKGQTLSPVSIIFGEPVNLILLWIILNCLNFGLYQFAPYRHILEALVPPLTGFEFARTAYFNTFLWYALFAVVLLRLYEEGRGFRSLAARGLACLAAVIVMFVPQVYNDFYYTVYNHAYMILKHRETSTVNYREFYSKDLFARIVDDIGYSGDWSAAYGFHPGILNYNGIASVDGYLGMYPEEYKETWQRVEAPAFAGSPSLKSYFDGWGARVCLYSGSDENTYAPLRNLELSDTRLMVDIDELGALNCRYIFSRIQFENADDLGLRSLGTWDGSEYASPYTITVYELPR